MEIERTEIPESLSVLFRRQLEASRREPFPSCGERRARLTRLQRAIESRISNVVKAIQADYGARSSHEILLSEVHLTLSHLKYTRRHLRRWMRRERRPVSWPFFPGKGWIHYQPLGVVGIVSPWNYPFYLALMPVIAALAAGNRLLLKPSEITPRTAELLQQIVETTLEQEVGAIVTGGPQVGRAFCELPFDHLFFTGSTRVGQSVLKAASRNLTPVTLELGGKSPAILGESFPVATFARRVAVGKFFNAGQTCIAPDYVLAPAGKVDQLVEELKKAIAVCYPTFEENPDYTAIVNDFHYERLKGHVRDAAEKGGSLVEVHPSRDEPVASGRKFPPTLVSGVKDDMQVMQEEIFGPILPIRPYTSLEEAVRYINSRPRPLALYIFERDRDRIRYALDHTCSGGVCINDTVVQAAQDALPFGGVGASGMGTYHGPEGFKTFSHAKAVFRQSPLAPSALLRPPYGCLANRILRMLVGRRGEQDK